jgi:hypothetical protein
VIDKQIPYGENMISDLTNAKYTAELSFLDGYLAELGFDSELIERSEVVPMPILVSSIGGDHAGRPRLLNFLFVPIEEDHLEVLQLLQIHSIFPFDVQSDKQADMEKLLSTINQKLGMGSVGIDEQGDIYYKYLFPKARYQPLEQTLIIETVQLFIFLMEQFSNLIESVATGQQSLTMAIEQLQRGNEA